MVKGRAILVLTYWSFNEALIQTYTLPYVRIIQKNLPDNSKIYLVTLEKKSFQLTKQEAKVLKSTLRSSGIHWIPLRYFPFGLKAFLQWGMALLFLFNLVIIKGISVIHCWCTPPGAVGYWLSVLTGTELILDSYEPHAEAMVENGTWTKKGLAFRILFWMERKQTERASSIVSATEIMRHYAHEKYGVNIQRFYVKPACVDLDLFSEKDLKDRQLVEQLGFAGKIVCVYAGKFGGIYLRSEIFDFLKVAADYWGDLFRVLLLTSHTREEILSYCQQASLPADLIVSTFVSHQQIPKYIGLGDFAITPVRPVPTKQYCTPIKDGEYWALGLPVVIPGRISDDSEIIKQNAIGAVLQSLTPEAYREAVERVDKLLHGSKSETFKKIRAIALRYRSFEIAEKVYRNIYGTPK